MNTKNNNPIEWLFPGVRREVLGLVFGEPDQSWHLRDIERKTGFSVNTVRRELNGLTNAELVVKRTDGNRTYYQANTQNLVFTELACLLRKTVGVLPLLRQTLKPLSDKIRIAFIYGSFAKNSARTESDIDVMIIGQCSFKDVAKAIHPIQEELGREINPSVYSLTEFKDKLIEGHHFLTSILKEPKLFLIGEDNELAELGR